jgi:transcriptional regulator with XRE-family HTH domain
MSKRHHVNGACLRTWHDRHVSKFRSRDDFTLKVGQRFADARKALGLSQAELGKRGGARQEAISRFENGDRGLDTGTLLGVLRAAAEAGVSLDDYVLRGIGAPLRESSPLTVIAQNPALQEALVQFAAALQKQEGESDGSPSEPKIPSHKGRKPAPSAR